MLDYKKKSDLSIVISVLNKTKNGILKWESLLDDDLDDVYQYKSEMKIDNIEDKYLRVELFINKRHNVFSYLRVYLCYNDYMLQVKEIDNNNNILDSILNNIIKE